MEEIIISDKKNTCSICLDDKDLNELCITNCNHNFCESCLITWFNRGNNSCPICRVNIHKFNLDEKETRLIVIRNEQNIRNVRINNIPVSEVIENLTNYNLKLRLFCYFLVIGGITLLDLYMNLRFNYLDLNIQYELCQRNITQSNEIINSFHQIYDSVMKVGIIYNSNHEYKFCNMPSYFVNHCFGNI